MLDAICSKFMSCLSLLTMARGKKRELKLHSVICGKTRGVEKRFVWFWLLKSADLILLEHKDQIGQVVFRQKALCRGQLHFNTIPVKEEGKNGLSI